MIVADVAFALWLLRTARGLSQSELGRKIHRSRQWVSKREIDGQPTVRSLRRLSNGLNVPVPVILIIAEARSRRALNKL
jgi:transcriptional regulator with XRE-family HTH domain